MQPNPLRNQLMTELREAAFRALSYNGSEKCERLLIKLQSSWRPALKRLAKETIERRRTILYGDEDHD